MSYGQSPALLGCERGGGKKGIVACVPRPSGIAGERTAIIAGGEKALRPGLFKLPTQREISTLSDCLPPSLPSCQVEAMPHFSMDKVAKPTNKRLRKDDPFPNKIPKAGDVVVLDAPLAPRAGNRASHANVVICIYKRPP